MTRDHGWLQAWTLMDYLRRLAQRPADRTKVVAACEAHRLRGVLPRDPRSSAKRLFEMPPELEESLMVFLRGRR
jgi:hypothetical protein